jgi:HPt (histidine-containing phosphotransfer) domain-containing protein
LDTVTYADHEVITPDHQTLRQAVVPAAAGDENPIARAEQALSQIAGEFGDWMSEECERLNAARHAINAEGLTTKNRDSLYRTADDIKGSAKTLGFPEAAPAAGSLCRLIEHSPDIKRISLELIGQHVDAIRAIMREHNRSDIANMASVLTKRLRFVTEEFLAQENRHRPEYLRAINSPSLVP